jgi:hypothetical protein
MMATRFGLNSPKLQTHSDEAGIRHTSYPPLKNAPLVQEVFNSNSLRPRRALPFVLDFQNAIGHVEIKHFAIGMASGFLVKHPGILKTLRASLVSLAGGFYGGLGLREGRIPKLAKFAL